MGRARITRLSGPTSRFPPDKWRDGRPAKHSPRRIRGAAGAARSPEADVENGARSRRALRDAVAPPQLRANSGTMPRGGLKGNVAGRCVPIEILRGLWL